ncbi:DUF4224 domain-containing protein [Acidovorax sp. PRC11]|uniref:DUF4224 domain-containing protein n=1 Tax=Acidovorax sp. PRC11 TaxID=2962592 RepID=UPI002881C40E|nr:DUF4224 domain-containing protein [Acidovorax sp. PRC11]MDT0137756.1 DUF4224 domain-containing protein [Acidovorax sp. PRC11]
MKGADATTSITLSQDELANITGYKRAADQLAELRRQGFFRARRSPTTGDVILERAHYDAVCAAARAPTAAARGPVVRRLQAV